jgi:hypothetical protein
MLKIKIPARFPAFLFFGLLLSSFFFLAPLLAADPYAGRYCPENNKVFWFVQTSDVHIGARGDQDSRNLDWLVTQGKSVINPSFMVVTGDLTDSTDGNILGWPDGPYQSEWNAYKAIVDGRVDPLFFFDLPGNHDHYNDQYFNYYRANSVQGRASGQTQVSWNRIFNFGKYHFLGVNTADNTGSSFSVIPPYGDNAGLDAAELAFIRGALEQNRDVKLTFMFGHHPLAPTANSSDTYLYYGAAEFIGYMNTYGVSLYGYGHTHAFDEDFFTQNMSGGIYYLNVASLGKSSANQYTVMAVDCDGLSMGIQTVKAWPAVLITAPMDRYLGGTVSPYVYPVPNGSSNPIRALVFDPNPVTQVRYRIDGGSTWYSMGNAGGNVYLWEALWNASSLPQGEHTIEVQAATASGTRGNTITVYVQAQQVLPVGVDSLLIGKYVNTGTKRNPVTSFAEVSSFIKGEKVVLRTRVVDGGGKVLANATVNFSISGPQAVTLVSNPSNTEGIAEATWQTSVPNRKGTGGTPSGNYSATVTNVTKTGYVWNGVQTGKPFQIQ